MKKKLLALGLATAMVASLAGCKNNAGNTETTAANGETTAAEVFIKQTSEVTDYSQYVTLGQYTGLEISEDAAVVTDEDVKSYEESVVSYYNDYYAESEQITDRATADGDTINMDYTGLKDGVAFEGGSSTGVAYTVGSGQFIESLDSQLAGLECGKTYDLNCKFPDDYDNADLAGQEVVFQVKVNYINGAKKTLEWSDQLVNAYTNGQYTTTADYEAYIKQSLITRAEEEQKNQYGNDLLNAIVDGCTINGYPQDKVDASAANYYDYYVQYFTTYASYMGMDYATYLSTYYEMNDADLKEECQNIAKQETTYIMVTCEIAKAIGYTLSDEEFSSKVSALAVENNYDSAQEFIDEYTEEYVRESLIYDYVSEYLLENNTMVINN